MTKHVWQETGEDWDPINGKHMGWKCAACLKEEQTPEWTDYGKHGQVDTWSAPPSEEGCDPELRIVYEIMES